MHTQYRQVAPGEKDCQPDEPTFVCHVPSFDSLSFEEAVHLFRQWGFQVEPGPRAAEVTLIREEPGYRNYTVYDVEMLPAIAAVALRARWQNGTLTQRREPVGGLSQALSRPLAELAC